MNFTYKACVLVLAIAASSIYIHRKLTFIPTIPLDDNQYWGPGDKPENEDATIYEFKINISKEVSLLWFIIVTFSTQTIPCRSCQIYKPGLLTLDQRLYHYKTSIISTALTQNS